MGAGDILKHGQFDIHFIIRMPNARQGEAEEAANLHCRIDGGKAVDGGILNVVALETDVERWSDQQPRVREKIRLDAGPWTVSERLFRSSRAAMNGIGS